MDVETLVLDKQTVARKLGVSERTIDRWRVLGKLKACQVVRRGRVMFRPEVVEQFIKSNERAA